MARPREMGTGWKFPTFACAYEDADLLAATLARHFRAHIEPAKTSFSGGLLHYSIDLSTLPLGEGPALQERIERVLHTARSRHKMPTEPPTSA